MSSPQPSGSEAKGPVILQWFVAMILLGVFERGGVIPDGLRLEVTEVLKLDQRNEQQPEPIGKALALLARDEDAFLQKYFVVTPDHASKGAFALTSR